MQPSPIEETVRADLPSVRRFNDMCSICASVSCLLAAFAARYAGLIGEFAAFCGCRGPNSTLLMGVPWIPIPRFGSERDLAKGKICSSGPGRLGAEGRADDDRGDLAPGAHSPQISRADSARAEAPRHPSKQAGEAWRLCPADGARLRDVRPGFAHRRRPDCAASLPKPYRLSPLRRLQDRRGLRDQAGL